MKYHYCDPILSINDFIMVIYARRNLITYSYAQVLNAKQTRPYFWGT